MINILPLEFQHHLFRENIMFFNYYFIHIINKNDVKKSLGRFYTAKKEKMLKINHLKKCKLKPKPNVEVLVSKI